MTAGADGQTLDGMSIQELNKQESSIQSIYQSCENRKSRKKSEMPDREMDDIKEYIKTNIEYDIACERFKKETVDDIVDIMADVYMTDGIITIGKRDYQAKYIQDIFDKIEFDHIEFVIRSFEDASKKNPIRNIKKYPLCAGLAGTWVINDDDMAARTLLANGTYQKLTRSNIFGNAIRFMGYNILQLFKLFLDGANNVLDNVYKMFSFYNSTNVNSYINNLIGFLWIPCVISILILGFQLIFNSKNRPDANKILQNGLIITILVTGMPALLSTTASMTKEFVNGDFNSRGSHTSDQVIAQCLTDYEYLYDWDQQRFVVTDENTLNSYVATNDYTRVNSIDINETIRYDNAGNPFAPNCDKWDSRDPVCMLCTIVTMKSDGIYQCEHIDEPQWWEFFSDSYFYRYDIDYVTCLITLGAMAVAIIFSAIKVARILWELAIYRVLAMFFSLADLHNGEKLKEIIKAFS